MMDRHRGVTLEACREAVRRLQRENLQLRRAAHASGQLAERINQLVRKHRRSGPHGLQVSSE